MRLKRALSQIKPTEGQREKIYGDILEKLSEDQPENEKETKFVMKKRKMISSVIAAAAAVVIVGGTVYAASPEIREMVRQVITVYGIPQDPVEGFGMLKEIGTKLPENSVQFEDFQLTELYAVNAEKTGENSYAVDNIAYGNGYVIVLCNEDGSGFYFEQGQQGTVNIVADLSSEYVRGDEGELSEVGYIFDGKAKSLFFGRIGEEGVAVDFNAENTGEYEFYIVNCCAGLQNYKSITVENRNSIEEYYDIKNAEGKNTLVTGIEAIKDGVTITENDFTEFAEGIRTKLVSVINTGTSVELLLEFEFDEPVTAVEYAIDYLHFKVPETVMKKQLDYSYGYGSLKASDNGRIYGDVGLDFTGYIPEGIEITLELNSLSYRPLGVPIENEKIIEGYYSTDFVIGPPVKSCSINIEPTEILWTQPYMGDAVAKMELSGLKFSPKYISVDLRMLEDCLVNYEFDPKAKYGTANYLNSTEMFFEGGNGKGSEFDPIKFKMSDGTLKDVQYDWVHSDAIMEFDMSAFETDTDIQSDDSPTVTTVRYDEKTEIPAVQKSDDWVRMTQDIPNDRPASITFEFNGIMDYSDVDAIVFCGVEIPINQSKT